MKDSKGNQIGRQFLVIRKDYGEKGTWEPFEKLIYCKKALKSFYNKHPELPYPNCLAENEDEEFEPRKNMNKGTKAASDQDKKRGGRAKQGKEASEFQQYTPAQNASNAAKLTPQKNPKDLNNQEEEKTVASDIRVQGLFADATTDEIIYHIFQAGKHFYQNRKWVLMNCKMQLIDFYQRCMRFK